MEVVEPTSRPGAPEAPPNRPPTEAALVDRLMAGDRDAAERLVEDSYELVFASLIRLCGDSDLAADLTQDTYRKAWSSLHTFQRGSKFSTWLYRIAYNTFLNHVRRPALMRPLDDERAAEIPGGDRDQSESLGVREVSARLRRAVLALPDELRLVVTARFWGEIPVREIATMENVTGPAIRKRLKKALRSIRHELERETAS